MTNDGKATILTPLTNIKNWSHCYIDTEGPEKKYSIAEIKQATI